MSITSASSVFFFFFQAEDGIREGHVTGVQTCALPISARERIFVRMAWREKRRARWEASREFWEAAARCARVFDARPWEEIAKIEEHRTRDFAAAHAVVTEALERARSLRAPELVLGALAHRLDRLARRLRPGL